jgi:hypothetical protein
LASGRTAYQKLRRTGWRVFNMKWLLGVTPWPTLHRGRKNRAALAA